MGAKFTAAVSNAAMAETCGLMQERFASHGMDLFENVTLDGRTAPFALATDECCFLVDRVQKSILLDFHAMSLMVKKLAQMEPEARIFGVLLLKTTEGISHEFLQFGKRHRVFLLKPDDMAGFIGKNLETMT